MDRVVCLVGMPIHIVSDNDILFDTAWWNAFVAALGVHHVKCDIYRPQGNGLVERANGRIISRLKTLLMKPPWGHSWVKQIPLAQWSINSCAGAAGYSGNEGLFGRHLSDLDGCYVC